MKFSITGVLALTTCTYVCNGFTISRPLCLKSSSNQSNTCIRTQVSYPVGTVKNTCLFAAYESVEEIELDVEERMEKSRDQVIKNLTTIRTGRASANILDLVQVDYYGAPTPLNQIATISVPNSQQLSISPFDKSSLKDIERAIVESDLGMTPNNDGTIIRLNIPPITEDRRKDLMKQCKGLGEDGKVAIRNIRRDGVEAVKKMEKAGDVSEDASKGSQEAIQKLTDKFVKAIDEIVAKKEKEVMTV
jgi:ribosome recycling factor